MRLAPGLSCVGWAGLANGKTRHPGTWVGARESRVPVVGHCGLCLEVLTEGYSERKRVLYRYQHSWVRVPGGCGPLP